jgi:hypothetical protein
VTYVATYGRQKPAVDFAKINKWIDKWVLFLENGFLKDKTFYLSRRRLLEVSLQLESKQETNLFKNIAKLKTIQGEKKVN